MLVKLPSGREVRIQRGTATTKQEPIGDGQMELIVNARTVQGEVVTVFEATVEVEPTTKREANRAATAVQTAALAVEEIGRLMLAA